MHHKRKRPKSARAGCLMCKPWKHQRTKGTSKFLKAGEKRSRDVYKEQMKLGTKS